MASWQEIHSFTSLLGRNSDARRHGIRMGRCTIEGKLICTINHSQMLILNQGQEYGGLEFRRVQLLASSWSRHPTYCSTALCMDGSLCRRRLSRAWQGLAGQSLLLPPAVYSVLRGIHPSFDPTVQAPTGIAVIRGATQGGRKPSANRQQYLGLDIAARHLPYRQCPDATTLHHWRQHA